MTIVAIGTASFGTASQDGLRMLREAGVAIRPNTLGRTLSEDEALALVRGADGWIAGAEPVTRRILAEVTTLRAVARVGTGLDTVDVEAARELGVAISRTPDAPTDAVAEMTLAGLLTLTRKIVPMQRAMAEGRWTRSLGASLRGATVLVVGYGRIGRRTAELLRAFGAEILVCDPNVPTESLESGERSVSLEEGLAQCDVVTLHASGTTTLLDDATLAHVKPGALLLNSARGHLVDEEALERALASGRLAGAWLDVFRHEPYAGPLTRREGVITTPHAATFTHRCRLQMEIAAATNLLRDLASQPARR